MSASSPHKKQRKSGWLRSVKKGLSKVLGHSHSQSSLHLSQSPLDTKQTTESLTSQSPDHRPSTSAPQAINTTSVNHAPLVAAPPTTDVASRNNNAYTMIGGTTDVAVPQTFVQKMKAEGSVAYEGLKAISQALYNCSDIFLPVKTAVGVFLEIDKVVDVRRSPCSEPIRD